MAEGNDPSPTALPPPVADTPPAAGDTPLWDAPVLGAWALCWRRPGMWLLLTVPALLSMEAGLVRSSLLPGGALYNANVGGLQIVPWCLANMLDFVATFCGVLLTVTMARELAGLHDGLQPAARVVKGRLGPLLGLTVVFVIIEGISLAIVGFVIMAGNYILPFHLDQPSPRTILGSAPFWIASFCVTSVIRLRVGFAFNGVLFCRQGEFDSVRESLRLTKAAWGRLAGYLLLASFPALISLLLNLLPAITLPYGRTGLAARAVVVLVTAVWSIYGTALWLLAWYRLRATKDGLSPAQLAAELYPNLPVPRPPQQRTIIPRDEPWEAPTTPLRRRKRR
jgi:hypothetical protein